MNKSKIDMLCEYLNDNVEERYPIENKVLANNTDCIKNGYLKMLAVVLLQSKNIHDSQLNLFRRIVLGANVENKVEDYLRMALDIEIDDYIKFSNDCKNIDLKYRWILDALIITCVENNESKQIVLLAQFCESLKITKKELKYIATMAGAIVRMSSTEYVNAYEIKEDTIPDNVFSDYMYLICNSCVCNNERMTIFQPTCKEDVTVQVLERIKEINTPCLKIIGAIIDGAEGDIIFEKRSKVILENCKFKNVNNCSLVFNKCKEIIISNSCFENFKKRVFFFDYSNSIVVRDCKFKNCKVHYMRSDSNWKNLGGVISGYYMNNTKFDLINSEFVDCGGVNSAGYCSSAFISDIKSFVDNCIFDSCWHYHHIHNKDPVHVERTMFTKDSIATNCKYIDSARFN
jgi:hypothetical protein